MCELLGLNFKYPVSASFSFRGFRHRSQNNAHGWGIARYDGAACQVFKEARKAEDSRLAEFIRDYEAFQSRIFIGHVRDATQGELNLANTHPFVRVFRGREIALAHNGTLKKVPLQDEDLSYCKVGQTDSEGILCALLTILERDQVPLDDYPRMEGILGDFNQGGTMNLLFSDGETLYCFKDKKGHNGLQLVERAAPFQPVSLKDEDWQVDFKEEKEPDQHGYVIASHPLTLDEPWVDLPRGRLFVFERGKLVYGNLES
jgi:predicted glutamine amidotransferase